MINDEITLRMNQVGTFLTGLAAAIPAEDNRPAEKTVEPRLPDPPTYLLAVAEKYKFSPPRSNHLSIKESRLTSN